MNIHGPESVFSVLCSEAQLAKRLEKIEMTKWRDFVCRRLSFWQRLLGGCCVCIRNRINSQSQNDNGNHSQHPVDSGNANIYGRAICSAGACWTGRWKAPRNHGNHFTLFISVFCFFAFAQIIYIDTNNANMHGRRPATRRNRRPTSTSAAVNWK